MRLILRRENRERDKRAPLTPAAAARLVEAGWRVYVERSASRIFSDGEYGAAGCQLTDPLSWVNAGSDDLVLGVGPLPDNPETLSATFAHSSRLFSEPAGWRDQMARFQHGGGRLYDIGAFKDADGRKLAGNGRMAGWLGAAIGLGRFLGRRLREPGPEQGLVPFDGHDELMDLLRPLAQRADPVSVAIIGGNGLAGAGAADLLGDLDVALSLWDRDATKDLATDRDLRDELFGHDMLINCAAPTGPDLLLASQEDLSSRACRIQMIVDVSCDPESPWNPLPVYAEPTNWDAPIRALGMNGRGGLVEIAALDDLPALLPRESSAEMSDQLVGLLLDYPVGGPWRQAAAMFDAALSRSAEI